MARKKTYADVMKELSKKKASYEQGLEEANRTGNRSGVADYKRRLTKLSAGMDELFQSQEASKAPAQGNFANGGMTKKEAMYATGGSYSSNMDPMKFEDGGDTGGEPPMAGTKFPRDNRMPGYYASGISLVPYDGRPGAMVQDGMMAIMQTTAGPIVLKPTTWKTYKTNPKAFNKFVEIISEDPQSYRQSAFDPETYEMGTFAKGTTGTFKANTQEAADIAQVQANVAAEAAGGTAKTATQIQVNEPAPTPSYGGLGDFDFMERMNTAMQWNTQDPDQQAILRAPLAADGTEPAAPEQQYETIVVDGATYRVPVTASDTASTPIGSTAVGTPTPGLGGGGTRVQANATATPTTAATATTPTAPARREFQQVTPLGSLDPSRILNTAKGDAYFGADGAGRSIIQDPLGPGTVGDPSIPTKSHGLGDLRNRIGDTASGLLGKIGGAGSGAGIPKGVGMALGAAAQFIPDLKTMKSMRDLEGPVDTPQMRAFVQDTNIDNTAALAAIKNQEARAMASAAQNISNPQVAAAAMRANQRIAAEQEARILSGEAQSELAMRNQNLGMLADVGNKNRMINAQNLQRQADFSNERLAAENRMRQQMGVKLGGAVSDFQNRAQDLKKWEMLSKLDLYNVAGRNDIDPTS